MNKSRWFLYFLGRSLGQRKGRVAVACVSVMIASAIVVSALGLSLGIRKKLGGELKAYGANIIVTHRAGFLDDALPARLREVAGVTGAAGQLYSPLTLNHAPVEMIGLDVDAVKELGWRLLGNWPRRDEALVGVNIRDALSLHEGDVVSLASGERDMKLRVSGFVETGGPEDSSVIMGLALAQKLTGLEGKLGAVLLRAESGGIERTVESLRKAHPSLEVKSLRQVARAEESFLGKIELLMALVTLVVLLASSISVSSTMSATVLERMKEIGLMRAIGGTNRGIRMFYLAEGCAIGLMGGISGYIVGFAAAQAVSRGAFGSFIHVPFSILAVSLAMGVAIAATASILPLADALRYKASAILRGE